MPYIQYDVDAKKQVPLVARAAGLPVAEVGWSLLELWEHVWMAGSDVVTELVLTGCVGPSEPLREALVAFGFVERLDGGRWRVRGTDRYTRTDEARSRGGKAAARNLIPGARHKAKDSSAALGCSREPAESQPRASPENLSADHRLNREPRTENREPEELRPPAEAGEDEDGPASAWVAIQSARADKGLPVESRQPRGFVDWEARARAQAGPDGVLRAYGRYLEDKDFADAGWPTAIFCVDSVWQPRTAPVRLVQRDPLTGALR